MVDTIDARVPVLRRSLTSHLMAPGNNVPAVVPVRYHEWRLKTGITRSREFERKALACFAVEHLARHTDGKRLVRGMHVDINDRCVRRVRDFPPGSSNVGTRCGNLDSQEGGCHGEPDGRLSRPSHRECLLSFG